MNQKLLGLVLAACSCVAALHAQSPAPKSPTSAPAQSPASTTSASAPATHIGTCDATTATQAPAAQTGSDADAATAPTLRLGVNEVNLIFTVTDKHGHYIPNLKLNDFALLDDQRAPEKVNSFRQQINLPLRVGIVIDASTSIRTRFQFEQQSATEFLLEILKAAAIAPLSWASM
jgi:Ca-activated chloride channel homolog